ncbi:MAG: hypothetical protein K9G62_01650 [Alphaproteobacteria bacterium]|nr:hypothetical protein [Alphaproteobacteria bacterium]
MSRINGYVNTAFAPDTETVSISQERYLQGCPYGTAKGMDGDKVLVDVKWVGFFSSPKEKMFAAGALLNLSDNERKYFQDLNQPK